MENTTRLLERHADLMASRRVLIVDGDDAALKQLPAASLTLPSDLASVSADEVQARPDVPAETDLLAIILPIARERLDLLLAALAGNLAGPTECWLVGPGKGGIRGALKQFAAVAGEPALLDSARHCKLYQGWLAPAPFSLSRFVRQWPAPGL